ncbi:unnamed protein product [Laminaria digitata]
MRRRRVALCSIFIVLEAARGALAFCPSATRALLADARYRDVGGGRGSASGHGQAATRSVVMAGSMAPPRTKAEKTSEKFSLSKEGMVVFGSSQRVEAPIAGASLASMQHYISDPARIVYACWDHPDITPMGEGVFRLAFSGQSFLSVSIDLSVDISIEAGANGVVKVKSVGYSMEYMAKLLGQDFVDTFFLELEGELRVEETETKVRKLTLKNTLLSGDVAVTIGGKMPGFLVATPEPLVKAAALGINTRVLEYVSNTFVSTIAGDYRQWSRDQKQTAQ